MYFAGYEKIWSVPGDAQSRKKWRRKIKWAAS